MKKLPSTDPVRIDAFLKKWRYNPDDRKANSVSLGMYGIQATISMVNKITFSLRMHVKGERRNKVFGRFAMESDGRVTYGASKAMAEGSALRDTWTDEAAGKLIVRPKDVPTFAKMLERYEAGLTTDPDALLTGKTLPLSWAKQLPQIKAVYAPFIEVNNGHGVKVENITRDDIHECHAKYLAKRLRETGNRPYSTVRLIFNAVHPILKWANEKHWIPDATLKGLRANVPDEPERKRFLLPGEWQAAAPAVDALEDIGLCMRYMLATACRRSMATGMKWGDLDTVDIREFGGTKLTLWCVPADEMKMKFLAIFPVVGMAAEIIESLRKRYGAKCEDHEYVFPETARNAWDNNADYWQKQVFEASGTKEWHRHDLRRTTASYLETFGADMPTVKKLLAHRGRADKSATDGYLSIGKNLGALSKLAPLLERVHKLYETIEAGKETADLRRAYAEIKTGEDTRAFMAELKIDKSWIEIKENEKHRAPVRELHPARA